MPSLDEVRAAAAPLGAGVAGDAATAWAVLGPWARERPDAAGATQAERLTEDCRLHVLGILSAPGNTMSVDQAIVLWLAKRLRSALPESVARYWAHVRRLLPDAIAAPLGPLPLVHQFLRRLLKLEGKGRVSDPPLLSDGDFAAFVASPDVPRVVKAVAIIAWRRAARIADVAELRLSGLVELPEQMSNVLGESRAEVAYEVAFDKTHPTGTWECLSFYLPVPELEIIRPWVAATRDPSHPATRPLLFPGLTAEAMGLWLTFFFRRPFGGHVFRRSAVRSAVLRGVPAWAIVALTMHSSREGFLCYAGGPSAEMREAAALFA